MKTIVKFFMLICMGMLFSCEKYSQSGPPTNPESVTVPFQATFTGKNVNSISKGDEACISGYTHITEVANGSGSQVGFSTYYADFCFNNLDLQPGYSYIKTQSGDMLYISYQGKTCLALGDEDDDSDHPDELCCWNVPFVVLGGTGMFEGADGEGTTDDYISYTDNVFHHSWKGTITLRSDKMK